MPEQVEQNEIAMPAPTAWPVVLAFGFTLLFAGLVTSFAVSGLGFVLTVAGCVGWFRNVLPHEQEELLRVLPDNGQIATSRRRLEQLSATPDQLRAWLPIRTYPVSAGLKGGLAGSVAMALVACVYGVFRAGSIWYPINLLAGAVYAESLRLTPAQISEFQMSSFAIALVVHILVSAMVGLLYGAMLPMFPRRPVLLGGLIAPVLWSGLIYTMLGLLNPLLESHIDWAWFVVSQAAFGIVAGIVVLRQLQLPTRENVAFFLRAGVEASGTILPDEK